MEARRRSQAAFALLTVGLGVALMFDQAVAAWALQCKTPVLDFLVGIINPIGAGVTLLIVCLALVALTRRLAWARLHDAAWLAALAFASAGLVEFTLKYLVGRPRPGAIVASAAPLSPAFAPEIDSFPSGHATSVFAVATIFAVYYPRLRWPLYGLAVAISLGRVYLERHYVSDIVAGAALGVAVAVLFYRHRRTLTGRMLLEPSLDHSR